MKAGLDHRKRFGGYKQRIREGKSHSDKYLRSREILNEARELCAKSEL